MSTLAPTLQAYITEHLIRQRQASPHTVAAYRDAFKLLLVFAQRQNGKAPSKLEIADLDAPLVGAFLQHLEVERGNSVRTRNARLAAIHSLFRYAGLRHPEDAAVIQRVLAMPPKRFDSTVVTYLTEDEIDALLAAPDQATWTGRRTGRCWHWHARPACGQASSPPRPWVMRTAAPARTSAVSARAAGSASHRLPPAPQDCSKPG